MTKFRLRTVAAAVALVVVPLAGCDAATEKVSAADACGDLIEISLRELRHVQESLGDPQAVARTYRDLAEDFKERASQIDDADVRRAANDYAARMRELAEQVRSGQAPDIDALAEANSRFGQACA